MSTGERLEQDALRAIASINEVADAERDGGKTAAVFLATSIGRATRRGASPTQAVEEAVRNLYNPSDRGSFILGVGHGGIPTDLQSEINQRLAYIQQETGLDPRRWGSVWVSSTPNSGIEAGTTGTLTLSHHSYHDRDLPVTDYELSVLAGQRRPLSITLRYGHVPSAINDRYNLIGISTSLPVVADSSDGPIIGVRIPGKDFQAIQRRR